MSIKILCLNILFNVALSVASFTEGNWRWGIYWITVMLLNSSLILIKGAP